MRTRRVLGGLAVTLLSAAAIVNPVEARPAPAILHVTGVAGSAYWVDVSRGTQLSNAGDYSTSPHRWSGVALVQPTRTFSPQVFVSLDLPQSLRCAGSSCPWLAPPPDLTSDGDGRLLPGRYRLVLLGERGTPVSVALQPLSGRIRLISPAPAVRVTAAHHDGTAVAGRQVLLHSFDQMPGGNGFAVVWSIQYLAVQPAGVFQSAACTTDGITDTVVTNLKDLGSCTGWGTDGPIAAGPTSVSPTTPGYAPVNAAALGEFGEQASSPMGIGWDASAVAPTAYLGDVFVGFSVPYGS